MLTTEACLWALSCIGVVLGQNTTNDDGYDHDPILALRPPFIMSLPIQLLITGIVLTLVSVLFIHLVFTAQYHWPLAPVNFVLQMSAVVTLLISLIATLHVVLTASGSDSSQWPYMLNYLAVTIPPDPDGEDSMWTDLERFTWSVMTATTSGLVQITHIQFLTLLYPSRLEAQLIYFMLVPLAVLSVAMQLVCTAADDSVADIADTIRNICNATLSLLFTVSLFVWGFFINRTGAWRTDGGTAAFGVSSLFLAVASTVLNFAYIPTQDQYSWLPGLMWAVVLWQSFLGWWWWVGAGNGMGEHDLEDKRRRDAKKQAKREQRRAATKAKKEKKTASQGFTGTFTLRKRHTAGVQGSDSDDYIDVTGNEPTRITVTPPSPTAESDASGSDTRTRAAPSARKTMFGRSAFGRAFAEWGNMLRNAHLIAARRQAVDQAERIQAVYGNQSRATNVEGWGNGSYQLRRMGADAAIEDDAATLREQEEGDVSQASVWWWGPLRRWRHQDSTKYS